MSLSKHIKCISTLLVVALSVCIFLASLVAFNIYADRSTKNYMGSYRPLYTVDFNDLEHQKFLEGLQEFAHDHEFVFVNYTRINQESEEVVLRISLYASNEGALKHLLPYGFMRSSVVDRDKALELLQDPIISYDPNTSSTSGSLPAVRGQFRFILESALQAEDLSFLSGVGGLSDSEYDELVDLLCQKTGRESRSFTDELRGYNLSPSLYIQILGALAVVCAFAYFLVVSAHVLSSLKDAGIYLMMGWSRIAVAFHILRGFICQLLIPFGVCLLMAIFFMQGVSINLFLLAYVCAIAGLSFMPMLLTFIFASIPIYSRDAISAIKGQFSSKGYLALAFIVYLFNALLILGSAHQFQDLYNTYEDFNRQKEAYSEYASWYGPHEYVKNGVSVQESIDLFMDPMWKWYKDRAEEEGVVFIRSQFYDQNYLMHLLGSGDSSNLYPFIQISSSPAYFKSIGIEYSDADLELAQGGMRIYFIPDTCPQEERRTLEGCISQACSQEGLMVDSSRTLSCKFVSYHPEGKYFTWSHTQEQPFYSEGPVFALVVPHNMTCLEGMNVMNNGFSRNVFIDPQAAKRLIGEDGLVGLGDNLSVSFNSNEAMFAEETENYAHIFTIYALLIAFMLVVAMVTTSAYISCTNRIRFEEIAVKHALGFGVRDIYRRQFLILNTPIIIGLVVGIISAVQTTIIASIVMAISVNVMMFAVAKRSCVAMLINSEMR